MNADKTPEMPLKGGRRKPAPRSRSEAVVKLKNRRYLYARLYPKGATRATYVSTHRQDVTTAQQLLPTLRAGHSRRDRAEAAAESTQPTLF